MNPKTSRFKSQKPRSVNGSWRPAEANLIDITNTARGKAAVVGAPLPNVQVYTRGPLMILIAPPSEKGNGWTLTIGRPHHAPSWSEVRSIIKALIPPGVHLAIEIPPEDEPGMPLYTVMAYELPTPEYLMQMGQREVNTANQLLDEYRTAVALTVTPMMTVQHGHAQGYVDGLQRALAVMMEHFHLNYITNMEQTPDEPLEPPPTN